MTDNTMLESALPLRVQRPALYTLMIAGFIGTFGGALQYFQSGGAGPIEAWRIGCLLAALGLWSWAALEGAAIARTRRGRTPLTLAAQAFAYGYFWTVAMMLMQWGQNPVHINWSVYGISGVMFGGLMAFVSTERDMTPVDSFFDRTHAVDRSPLIRAMFFVWPVASVATVSWWVLQPAINEWHRGYLPAQMVLFAAIWPLSYDIAPAQRRMFTGFMGLGFALVLLAILTP